MISSIVLDEKNNEVRLSSLWKKQTIIFIFLRHFACIACRSHAVQIWNDREKYEKNGAKIIFIGNGTPEYIKYFKEDLKITDAPIFTDPTLESFRSAGFKRSLGGLLHPKTLVNGVKLISEGHRQIKSTPETGDHLQLGGVLVVHSDSSIGYRYISQVFGDFPPEEELIGIE